MREIDASDLKIGEEFEDLRGFRFMCTDGHQRVAGYERGFAWGIFLEGPCKGKLFIFDRWSRVKVDRPVEQIALVRVDGEDRYDFGIPSDAHVLCFYLDRGNLSITGRMFDRVLYSDRAREALDLVEALEARVK